MSTLKKIHLVKGSAEAKHLKMAVGVWNKFGEEMMKQELPDRNETYCGKIMQPKFVTTDPKKVTCTECFNERFKPVENVQA